MLLNLARSRLVQVAFTLLSSDDFFRWRRDGRATVKEQLHLKPALESMQDVAVKSFPRLVSSRGAVADPGFLEGDCSIVLRAKI